MAIEKQSEQFASSIKAITESNANMFKSFAEMMQKAMAAPPMMPPPVPAPPISAMTPLLASSTLAPTMTSSMLDSRTPASTLPPPLSPESDYSLSATVFNSMECVNKDN